MRGQCLARNNHNEQTFLAEDLAAGTFKLVVDAKAVVSALPKPAQTNPQLVKEATGLLAAAWQGDQVLKVVIVDKAWTVERVRVQGKLVPKRRTINTVVAVQQPKTCRVFDVMFEQEATGPASFGPTTLGGTGASRVVPCGALK